MITMIYPVKRRKGLSAEEYHRHWRDLHAPLIRDTPSIARHILRYTQYPSAPGEYVDGREPVWDGIAVAQHTSLADLQALANEPEYSRLLRPDEDYLVDRESVQWLLCENIHRVIG